ncbi:zf-HC2 domain-containing protein [Cohnella ginsengisoli]|uniref:Zf-HC2 domain-containing protein n=1 Tax=Cohnella ginsengisoli TaxID=425004 RepID=A0A9X4KGA2_9BACL|nr:zf-HC2 domain-containing protein [Cohnella ginsengisoli]MDG0791191.1 zf-HC2 domain-containing protein [Cohnella ginsengisoli]
MEPRLNCEIVQDLLPNYIEGLTGESTNKSIQAHLADCENCRKALEQMTRDTQGIKGAPPKQINFMKKIKRRQWLIASVSVAIVAVLLIGAYYLFGTRDFPVPASDVKVSDVYRTNDGTVHFRVTAHVKGFVSRVSTHGNKHTEIYRIYEHRQLFSMEKESVVALPENWLSTKNANTNLEKTGIYFEGIDKNDRIVIWEKDMTVPPATAEQEEAYRKYLGK